MSHRNASRRTLLTATAVAATALAAPSAAHAAGGGDRGRDRKLREIISRMSLEEKVGQLFVMHVYGHSATEPDQADIDSNLEELGVRTAAEAVAKYHLGGIIYFGWAHNT
ncbi:glycoside hydrolase family 3 protein, partial [Streptomyces sp. NPDC059900]